MSSVNIKKNVLMNQDETFQYFANLMLKFSSSFICKTSFSPNSSVNENKKWRHSVLGIQDSFKRWSTRMCAQFSAQAGISEEVPIWKKSAPVLNKT